MKIRYICVILRLGLGLVFVISGVEKLLQPYQNFLYIIQGYDVLPSYAIQWIVALLFPWLEVIVGVFLILGLWTKISLLGLWVMVSGLMGVVGQAIVRNLNLSECGCFGDLLSIPLPVIMAMDTAFWVTIAFLLFFIQQTKFFSLDNYFSRAE